MKHISAHDVPTATHVLSIEDDSVPLFVHRCVRERSLSALVSELNNNLLFGDLDERDAARKALKHIGFI